MATRTLTTTSHQLGAVVCQEGCRIDHRGDARYEAERRAYLLARARARRAQAA